MFITLEGPEGSGKSTQMRRLTAWLEAQGYPLIVTREPGGTRIGDQIRTVIVGLENTELVPEAELLLFSASRAQHVWERIRPSLREGKIVLCDRFYDSTLAYQGYGHGLSLATLRQITEFATGGLRPDLTVLLDLDAAEGLHRRRAASANGDEWNRLDEQQLAFHQRVRDGYLSLAAAEPERWVVIDAAPSADEVQSALRAAIAERLVSGGAA